MALGFLPVFAMRSFIASSSSCGSMFHVSSSESTNTGVAPRYVTGWDDAQNVKLWTSTSSPGPTPHASSARCTAAVPAESATTFLSSTLLFAAPLQSFAKASKSTSKPLTLGPRGTTQFVSNASWIYFISFPLM